MHNKYLYVRLKRVTLPILVSSLIATGFAPVAQATPSDTSTVVTDSQLEKITDNTDDPDYVPDFSEDIDSPPPDDPDGSEEAEKDETKTANAAHPDSSITPIAEIQGTSAESPLLKQQVTTQGIVTAAYPEGGFRGFYIQTPGTGKTEKHSGDASDGLYVYLGKNEKKLKTMPKVGDSVIVRGQVVEFKELTQLNNPVVTISDTAFEPVVPIQVTNIPAGDIREAYEGMLVQPTGAHTVTSNYTLNTYGTIGLALGDSAYRQATDFIAPGRKAAEIMAQQAAEQFTLDDGRGVNYLYSDKNTPLPYIAQDNATVIKSLRTGDPVSFQHPVIVDYRFDQWNFQPTTPITGNTAGVDLPITWTESREAELGRVDNVAGQYSLASFNVLNYFTTLGETKGCKSNNDRHGNPVTAKCSAVRGAHTHNAFADQQRKIVAAINRLNVDVLGLEEIENTETTGSGDRDYALKNLVDALNAAAGSQRWAYVASPETRGDNEDLIRVAFIYNPATIKPVGQSHIFNDDAFTGKARQPLAQEFSAIKDEKARFVVVVNHFKSKGSVIDNDQDTGDGQGNNATVRRKQSEALIKHLKSHTEWNNSPVFILGDLNSYSREDAVTTIEKAGFSNIAEKYDAGISYQFSGRLGSLDHALGNEAAMKLVRGAEVWDINSDEPVAFEYALRNFNAVDFYQDNVFRSSDHDPIKVGFDLFEKQSQPQDPDDSSSAKPGIWKTILAVLSTAALISGVIAFLATMLFPGFKDMLNRLSS
ncbi:ExeM/NucH family extracellular endonuclease [Corynebacterium kutscheri]|uniref:ExeM/NucH family extracellular endonuclease n=1 Tax=Corynebacterium kutscheri TaxID=35755 RepID=UPI0037C051A4